MPVTRGGRGVGFLLIGVGVREVCCGSGLTREG